MSTEEQRAVTTIPCSQQICKVCILLSSIFYVSQTVCGKCDVTPNTLTDRYIQCHENITSYQYEAYGLSERDAMYKGDQHIHHCTYKSPEVHFRIDHSMQ